MFRLYLALFASKLYLFISKILKKDKSDKAGLLAARICPNILELINKPNLVIMVTGTNGKTTICHLLNKSLTLSGKKVGFNTWNANMIAGHIRCLIDCVNIFNKPNKDCALLECDESTSDYTFPSIKPNYVIVTNVSRDSIRRNAYPEYIYNKINEGLKNSKETTVVLNADDPISSFLGENNKKVYISIDNIIKNETKENISQDFTVCPNCNNKIEYDYRFYRQIGKWHCNNCKKESYKGDYIVKNINENKKELTLNKEKYILLSNKIHNIYNEVQVIVLLKLLGYTKDEINKCLEKCEIPKSREDLEIEDGIKIYSRMAKGQNSSAASTVFENLVKESSKKQLVCIFDEVYDGLDAQETITWLYDTDFEFLTNPCIEKIIVPSVRYKDYIVRLKLAGIDENKIDCFEDYHEIGKHVNLDGKTDIYVLYEVDERPVSREVVSLIKEEIKRRK